MRAGIEGGGEPAQVGRHAVDPDGVGIDVEERRVAELRQRLDDAAAGAEQLRALVGDDDFAGAAAAPDAARSDRRGDAR